MGEMRRVPSKRWFSSPERRFTGALVYSLLGTCFYHKAWNFIPNIFTEHLLHACHESSELYSMICKQGMEVWAFCTKLCGFLNGHKLIIYRPKSKTCKY